MDINGFPVGASAETGRATANIRTFRVPGTTVDLPVCADVAPLLVGLAEEFHRTVEPLDPRSCWGYAYRNVRGGTTPSFHAAGIAVDLNAPRHPLGRRGTFTPAQTSRCRELAAKYGCRWGGNYAGRADEMHFEVILPRAEAVALVQRIGEGYPLPAGHCFEVDPDGRSVRGHDGREAADRPAVVRIQLAVGVAADGRYGVRTAEAVRSWQGARGLVADGIVGPRTWAALTAPAAALTAPAVAAAAAPVPASPTGGPARPR
jgi:peptidoglycan hydrolase-like protein with peptidoglycan-binding domain